MPHYSNFEPKGVIPACILPFHDDLSIDERAFRDHLRQTADVPGVSAITVNAHATEVASCNFEEQRRVLEVTMETVGDRVPVVNGVYADGSVEAARLAHMAEQGGASALLVFPPNPFTLGQTPEMVLAHFRTIADATGLPLIAFQYPLAGGQGYPMETLLRLIEAVPTVRAIKDWCNVVTQHERHIRVLQSLPRRVNVLSTHSSWLFSSLVLGCRGLLSGMGSVVADLQSALFSAVQSNDLARARALNDRLNPLAAAFYADPFVDMHNRMKAALVLVGRIPCAAVRPPLIKVGAAEIERIRLALEKAQVSHDGAMLEAA
jgi:4-hydroxy-tetrahydrodipicolinate synthase